MLISNGLLNPQTNCPSGLSPSQYIKIPIKTPVYRLKPSYVISGSTPLTSSASTLRIPSLAVWAVAAVPLRLVAHLPQAEHQEFPWRKWPNTTARRIAGWSSALTLLQFSLVFCLGRGRAPSGNQTENNWVDLKWPELWVFWGSNLGNLGTYYLLLCDIYNSCSNLGSVISFIHVRNQRDLEFYFSC